MQKIQLLFKTIFRTNKTRQVTGEGKMLYLESIRGLAALSVVWAHILATYIPAAMVGPGYNVTGRGTTFSSLFYGFPFGFTEAGHFAVVLFFTLSGFVLSYKYFKTKNIGELQKQAAKRYFRLAIPVFATVMVSWVLISNGAFSHTAKIVEITGSPEAGRIFNFAPTLWSALYDATIGVLVNGSTQYNPVLWTMPVEFIGSFVLFGFLTLVGGLRYRWIFYIASVVLLNHSYYTCFILGAVLADIATNTKLIERVREKVSVVYMYTTLLIVTLMASFPYPDQGADGQRFQTIPFPGVDAGTSYVLWHFVAAFLLLSIILVRKEIQSILSTRALVFIGGLSFSLYLTHYLVLHSLGDTTFVYLSHNLSLGLSAAIAAILVVVVTMFVSIVWKKYVDDMSVQVSRSMARILLQSSK